MGGTGGILRTAAEGMAAKESSDLMAIAASRHRAPAAAVCAGVIVEKEPARRVRAAANGSRRTFRKKVGGRTGHGGEQPLEATLAGNELERPATFTGDKFIVPFSNAQDFVDRLHPGRRERLPVHHRSKDSPERLAKPQGTEEDGVDGPGFRRKKRAEARGAVL